MASLPYARLKPQSQITDLQESGLSPSVPPKPSISRAFEWAVQRHSPHPHSRRGAMPYFPAVSEVETAWVTLEREQAREAALLLSLQHNQASVDIATELYKTGESDYIEVLTDQKSYLSAQQSLVQHRATLAQQSVKRFKALGGPVAE